MVNNTILIYEALHQASIFLSQHEKDPQLAQAIFLQWKDWTLTELVSRMNTHLTSDEHITFQQILNRFVADEPLAYILGRSYFKDQCFKVNPHTLIPREETEGILDLLIEHRSKEQVQRLIDIGTGTGILAICAAQYYPAAEVIGTDISEGALEVARENAAEHQVAIRWIESDVWDQVPSKRYDVILSNPPYISEDEQSVMDASVLKYEPTKALFAESNGLAIYQRIASGLHSYIASEGIAILEIGYRQGESVRAIFQEACPTAEVSVHQDFNQLDRYVVVDFGTPGEEGKDE